MTLTQLNYIIVIAETRSINKAAEQLYVSQPSLTNAVQELEKELGITLFHRSGRGVTLTNDGAEFLLYAKQLYGQYEDMMEKYGKGGARKKKFGVSTQHYSFAVKAFVEMARKLDLAAIEDTRRRDDRIVRTAQVATELAGAVTLAEVAVRCEELFGFRPEEHEVEDALIEAYRDYRRDVTFVPWGTWRDGGLNIVVDSELDSIEMQSFAHGDSVRRAWALMPWMSEAETMPGASEPHSDEYDRDSLAYRLVSDQAWWNRFERLKIDSSLAEMDVIDWERRLPEIVALRNWLDAHVPERKSDHLFADSVIDGLLRRRSARIDFTVFATWTQRFELFRLTSDAEELCSLLANAFCALPSWRYGGRSPHAVAGLLATSRAASEKGPGMAAGDTALAAVA